MQASFTLADRKWSWNLLPLKASSTGLPTIIPIYMLALGGQVREVAAAMFLSNLAVTPSYGVTITLAIAFLGASLRLVSKYFRKVVVIKAAA